jgi:hypothetical protein
MPSARRLRLVTLAALAVIVTTLFFTSQWRSTSERDSRTIQDFFGRTTSALDASERGSGGSQVVLTPVKDKDGDGSVDKDDELLAEEMAARVHAAEKKAKELANAKALKPDSPSEIVGVGSSAGGQKKLKGTGKASEDDKDEETPEEHELEIILNEIFKKSPGMPTKNSVHVFTLTDQLQSSSFPRRSALIRNERRLSSLINIPSSRRHLSLNSTYTPRVRNCNPNLPR